MELVSTSPSQGSKSPHLTDWTPLYNKLIVILPDRDEPGRKFVESVIGLIRQQVQYPGIVVKHLWDDLPDLEESGDAYDWSEYYDSASAETLQAKLESLPNRFGEYTPKVPEKVDAQESSGLELWLPEKIGDILDPPNENAPVIDGMLRRGEVGSIIAVHGGWDLQTTERHVRKFEARIPAPSNRPNATS